MKNLKEDYKERATNCTARNILENYTLFRASGEIKQDNIDIKLEEKRDDVLDKLYNAQKMGDPQNKRIKFVL